MLTAVLFALDATTGDTLREVSGRCRQVRVDRIVTRALQNYEVVRVINSQDPDAVLVDYADPLWAQELAETVAQHAPRTVVIGLLARGADHPSEPAIHGWLEVPCRETDLDRVAVEAVLQAQRREERAFFTFLPAKAGCGATTVAMHVADALANQMNRRTLLIDGDLRSGVVGLLLKLPEHKSLRGALAISADLQPVQWNQHVSTLEKLDVLASHPEEEGPLPTWPDYYKLLKFSVPRYEAVVADLPELVNDATQEVLRLSRRVLIVVTAELPALKLAARRVEEVVRRGVNADRVALVVNRYHSRDIALREIERLVSCPVAAALPNDYRAVQKAISIGGFVNPETGLGSAYGELAARLWEGKTEVTAHKAKAAGVFAWLVQSF